MELIVPVRDGHHDSVIIAVVAFPTVRPHGGWTRCSCHCHDREENAAFSLGLLLQYRRHQGGDAGAAW
jgi:hypothetical protein